MSGDPGPYRKDTASKRTDAGHGRTAWIAAGRTDRCRSCFSAFSVFSVFSAFSVARPSTWAIRAIAAAPSW